MIVLVTGTAVREYMICGIKVVLTRDFYKKAHQIATVKREVV